MEHNYAMENHTAERYLLQELDEQERDAYEEHFFSCSACAEEVKIAAEFLDSAKRVVQQELKEQLYGHVVHRSLWGSWLNWRSMVHPMPAMACLLLVVSVGFGTYQNRVTIPGLRQAASMQLIGSPFVLKAARDATQTFVASHGHGFILRFSIPPTNSQSYDAALLDAANIRRASFDNISAQDATYPLEISVPPNALQSGTYVVVVTDGKAKGEVERFSFNLRVQDQ